MAGLAGTTALNAATYADMAMRGAVLLWQHGATFTGFPGAPAGATRHVVSARPAA